MTNALPAFLQNRQSKALAPSLVANLGVGTPPYISIANNRFTLVDAGGAEEPVATYDPKTGPYLDCVIVDSNDHLSKVFYDKPYDPSASQYEPPACFSDNGVGPSRAAPRPQSATCAQCPNAVWGSKISAVSGKGVKACSDQQKLAIMIPGDEAVFLMRVPPNTLSNLRSYTAKFAGQSVDVSDVITRIAFESQGTLKFEAVNYIDEATFARREALLTAHSTDGLVGRTDLPRQDVLAPAQQVQAALPAPAQQVQQPAPFVPAVAPSAVAQPAPALPAPATASPSEPRQRRRRTAAEPAQGAPGNAAPAMAPFRPQEAAAPAQPANFGIQQGAAPDAALQQTLSSIFGPGQ